jgi:hypothetical protein
MIFFDLECSSGFKPIPNLNYTLSINLIEAGLIPASPTSSINLIPTSKSGNMIDPYLLTAGNFLIFKTASVINPKFPSYPNTIYLKSGPFEILGHDPV